MRRKRVLAAALCGVGCVMCFCGLESATSAVECTPQLHTPAICVPAHEEPKLNEPYDAACVRDAMEMCVPGEGSICGTSLGWGWVVAGKCEAEYDASHPTKCTQDFAVTIVDLHRWSSFCKDDAGNCKCEFHPCESESERVEVCDCKQESF